MSRTSETVVHTSVPNVSQNRRHALSSLAFSCIAHIFLQLLALSGVLYYPRFQLVRVT